MRKTIKELLKEQYIEKDPKTYDEAFNYIEELENELIEIAREFKKDMNYQWEIGQGKWNEKEY